MLLDNHFEYSAEKKEKKKKYIYIYIYIHFGLLESVV